MKKILTAIALIACFILPLSAMAMTTVADNELSTITGQSGVSMNINATINLNLGTIAWGDSDGASAYGYASAGYVGIEALNATIHLSGRHDGVFENNATAFNYLLNKPLTIDVGTAAGVTKVFIGLPTFEINVGSLGTNVFLSAEGAVGVPSTTHQVLGSLYLSGVEVKLGTTATPSDASTFDAGYIAIGAIHTAANVGVGIGFSVKIDSVVIGTMSWGNTTSILASSALGPAGFNAVSGGYIGMKGFTLDDVTISGGIGIGITTLNGAAAGVAAFGTHTMVAIAINDGTQIYIPGAISGTITLADNNLLTSGAENLGNFYIGGVTATVVNNAAQAGWSATPSQSLIEIWAH